MALVSFENCIQNVDWPVLLVFAVNSTEMSKTRSIQHMKPDERLDTLEKLFLCSGRLNIFKQIYHKTQSNINFATSIIHSMI